jgi:hypothetical protein
LAHLPFVSLVRKDAERRKLLAIVKGAQNANSDNQRTFEHSSPRLQVDLTRPRPGPEPEGYAAEIAIDAPNGDVFEAITTDEELSGWWASRATGSGPAGASVVLALEETITLPIDAETYPTHVVLDLSSAHRSARLGWDDGCL